MWNLRLSGDLGMAAACGCVGFGCPCGTPGGHMAPLTWTERAEVRMDQEMLDRVAAMPLAGNVQPYGLLHGGASCVLAETIGSLAAALHAGLGQVVVGIEISATHHRGAWDGEVTAVATLAHGGRTLATYDIVITDTAGRRVCTSRLTCLIRDQVPGREADGVDPLREQGVTGS